jgi:hypothetical protein
MNGCVTRDEGLVRPRGADGLSNTTATSAVLTLNPIIACKIEGFTTGQTHIRRGSSHAPLRRGRAIATGTTSSAK